MKIFLGKNSQRGIFFQSKNCLSRFISGEECAEIASGTRVEKNVFRHWWNMHYRVHCEHTSRPASERVREREIQWWWESPRSICLRGCAAFVHDQTMGRGRTSPARRDAARETTSVQHLSVREQARARDNWKEPWPFDIVSRQLDVCGEHNVRSLCSSLVLDTDTCCLCIRFPSIFGMIGNVLFKSEHDIDAWKWQWW
jgi:hypothetical protein